MRLGLIVFLILFISGCASHQPPYSNKQKQNQQKNNPYEDSVYDTMKKRQDIYIQEQLMKPRR